MPITTAAHYFPTKTNMLIPLPSATQFNHHNSSITNYDTGDTKIAQLGDSTLLELLVVKLMTIGALNVNNFLGIIQSSIVSSNSVLLVTKTTT